MTHLTVEPTDVPLDSGRGARAALALALAVAAVTTGWVALSLLARVTPALFPGQALPVSAALPGALSPLEIKQPGPDSIFNDPIVFLVAGIDTRPDQPGGLEAVNTDSIMLVRMDPAADETRVLSVPRDLLIDVTFEDGETAPARVNMSFAVGAMEKGDVGAGMDNLRDDLEREFNLEIDHWILVDILSSERLLDELGGVEVTIPKDLAVRSWWYSNDDKDHRLLSFPPGPQHLDGYHAVAFARLREYDDDLHRIHRQQIVMRAAMRQLLSSGIPRDALSLWSAYKASVRTDVPVSLMPGYAALLKRAGSDFATYSLGDPVDGAPSVEDRTLPSGAAVLVGVPENIEYWLDQFSGEAGEAGREDLSRLPVP